MKTIDIKGKLYVMVNERILFFKKNFPDHKIQTQILSNENGVCVFKAIIADKENHIVATGHAYEKEGSTFINKTSYIENCETSAVGRALGMLGIGIETSIATAEEVGNAIANQGKKPPVPSKAKIWHDELERIETIFEEKGLSFGDAIIDLGYKVDDFYNLKDEDLKAEAVEFLRSKYQEAKETK